MGRTRQILQRAANRFGFQSVFVQTFLAVLMLSLLVFGAFSFYTLHMENSNARKRTEAAYLNMLEITGTATEVTLQNLQQLMQQTMGRKEFTNAMIVPGTDDYDRTLDIISQLRRIADAYPFVDRASLYIPTDGMVYSSDLSYLPTDQSPDPIFQDSERLTSFRGVRLSPSTTAPVLFRMGDRLVLCQHLYPDFVQTIGVLVFELNLSILKVPLSQPTSPQLSSFYVFDVDGKPVFAQEVPQEVAEQAAALRQGHGEKTKGMMEGAGKTLYFYYQSPSTRWLYLYPAGAQLLHVSPSLERILFFGCLAAVVGLLFSLQIASRANRPIRGLLSALGQGEGDTLQGKNEVDYLARTYQDTAIQNRTLHHAIQSVTPLVLERLFSDILAGRTGAPEVIDQTLESLGQPLLPQSRFIVLALSILNPAKTELTVLEMNLQVLEIRTLLSRPHTSSYLSCLVQTDNQTAAVVLAFSPGAPDDEIQRAAMQLCGELEHRVPESRCQVETGYGNIYNNAVDARYSYLEAQKNLNHRRFYGTAGDSGQSGGLPTFNRYFERTNQMFSLIQGDNLTAAIQLADQILKEIAQAGQGLYAARQEYERFMETMFEISDNLYIGAMDELLCMRAQFRSQVAQCQTAEGLYAEVRTFFEDAIRILEHKNRKKAYQHVVRVQEYIHANYANSGLSLYTAAEQIGIGPTYLSRLFKTEMGTAFVDYVNRYRVEKSQYLLQSSQLLVKDIAYQTGFNSLQNFFRIFKKYTGISPGEYRQNSRK